MLNTGKIYLLKILRNTVCWTLWEDLFTQNTEEYRMLNTVGRFIYPKYWGILYVEHCGKMYLHKILRNILYVEHCGKIYLHKILYVEHWEDLFTQNTEEYFMLNTVRRFIYTKYWGIVNAVHCGKIYLHKLLRNTLCSTLGKIYLHTILRNTVCWTLWEDLFTQNTEEYTVCWTLWEDLFTQNTEEYCTWNTEKIYLHKILRNTSCWTLWEDLFPQNTE